MNYEEIVYVTADGMKMMNEELTQLVEVRSAEITVKLDAAIADGDLDDNMQYLDAKKEQAIVQERIVQLEEAIKYAVLVEEDEPTDAVRVGSTVRIAEEGWDDEVEEYRIVGALAAEPSAGKISNRSPIGSALLGAKIGDIVAALTPGGETRFRILAIV